jgi:GntR family histidine utilization transcriptional repressor
MSPSPPSPHPDRIGPTRREPVSSRRPAIRKGTPLASPAPRYRQIEERFVNPKWVPDYLDTDFSRHTPNEVLVAACPISDVEHVAEAVLADAQTAAWLGITTATPCLLMVRRTWSDEHLVSDARLTHPGDRYKLRSSMRNLR